MKVLVIEDDSATVDTLELAFEFRWPDTHLISSANGADCARLVEKTSPDIVILDLGLPDIDGMAVLQEVRQFSDVPVIILTGRTQQASIIKCLELGADDYISKPFDPMVLVARVKSVLRRSHAIDFGDREEPVIYDNTVIDFETREVTRYGKRVRLTSTEWQLLHCLVQNKGKIVPYQIIWERVWGSEYFDDIPAIRTCVWRLRTKLGDDATSPKIIVGERGVGYRFIMQK